MEVNLDDDMEFKVSLTMEEGGRIKIFLNGYDGKTKRWRKLEVTEFASIDEFDRASEKLKALRRKFYWGKGRDLGLL